MNWDQTCDLLTLAAAYDSRTVGESDVQAWLLALADLPFDRCRDAVVRHYSTETDRIMPGHVRRLARSTTGASVPPGEVMCPSCHAVHGPHESCAVLVADRTRWRQALGYGRSLAAAIPPGAPDDEDSARPDAIRASWDDDQAAATVEAERERQIEELSAAYPGAAVVPDGMRFNEPPPVDARADLSPTGGTGAPPTDSEPGATAYQTCEETP